MNASRFKESWHRRLLPLILIALGFVTILFLLAWLSHPVPVSAAQTDLNRFTSLYPAAMGARLDTCATCHTSAPALNAYGADYKSHGRTSAALTAIEPLDSDGDGWTNLQEIQGETFPGSATDHPAGTPAPTAGATSTGAPTVGATGTGVPGPTATSTPVPIGQLFMRIFLPLVSEQ